MNNYKIYKYTSPSGGVYIGQTTKTIEERSRDGYYYSLLNKKTGKFLQPAIANALLKYGWDNFKKEILYENLTSEEADELEQELIKYHKENGICYNICNGGKNCEGARKQSVKQYTLQGEFIKQWERIKDVEIFLNVKGAEGNIVACCKGRKKRAYGYIWRYVDDNSPIKPLRPYRTAICQFNINNEYIATYSNIAEASRETGIHESGIGNVLHNRAKTAGGYVWRFVSECQDFIK